MGKGSGACSRQPLAIEAGVNHIDSEAGCPPVSSETDYLGSLNLNLKRIKASEIFKWVSADYQVTFNKNSKGWYVSSYSNIFNAALAKVGLDSQDIIFPSLKEARGAVAEAALYSNLSFNPKLKYPPSFYQIGSLPLKVYFNGSSWKVETYTYLPQLPEDIACYFPGGITEIWVALAETHVLKTKYPTRQSAVSDVKEWLQEYIKNCQ